MMPEYIFTRATRFVDTKTMVYSRIRTTGEIEATVDILSDGEISRLPSSDYPFDYLEMTILPIEPYTSDDGIYEICSETEFNIMWQLAGRH